MAIAFDYGTNSGDNLSGPGSVFYNHVVGAGANMGIIATVHTAFQNITVGTVTCGGVPMTHVAIESDGQIDRITVFYLRAPSAGTQQMVFYFSGALAFLIASSVSFSGLDQTGGTSAIEATAGSLNTTANGTIKITNLSPNAYIFADYFDDPSGAAGTATPQSGQTETYNIGNGGGEDAQGYKALSGTASNSIVWSTNSTGPTWVMTALSLKPAAIPSQIKTYLSLTGAGIG